MRRVLGTLQQQQGGPDEEGEPVLCSSLTPWPGERRIGKVSCMLHAARCMLELGEDLWMIRVHRERQMTKAHYPIAWATGFFSLRPPTLPGCIDLLESFNGL